MSTARAILATLRPQQWIKNLFVVAPLVFSKHLFDTDYVLRSVAATLAFCALSGAVYAFNDIRDAALDREHPTKCRRPIASGAISPRTAGIAAAVLAIGALIACALLASYLAIAAAGYACLNLAYSLGLKRIPFVDVLIVASGFLLRVVGGALAISVPMSPWLLACSTLLAMMLGFGKRIHELIVARRDGREPSATRASLRGYGETTLRWVMGVLAVATCVAYALYTQTDRTVAFFGTRQLIWTVPFILVGIGRFLQLAITQPREESPTDAILRDWPFLMNIALWGAAVLLIIYGAR